MFVARHCSALGLALVCSAASARATSSLEVPLVTVGCPREYAIELPTSLRVEINALTQERSQTQPPALRQIAVTCLKPTRVHIEVMLVQGTSASIDMDQSSIAPEARTRALALSAVELVDGLWTSVIAPPPPTPAATLPQARPRASSITPAASHQRYCSLSLGPVVERVGQPGAWLFGGQIDSEWSPAGYVTPMAQLRGQFGLAGVDAMPVRVTSWSGAAYAMIGPRSRQWRWGIGPGARAGVASLSGEAHRDSQLRGYAMTAPWGGLGVRAAVSHKLADVPLRLSLAADVGVVTLRAVGTLDQSRRVYALDGPWFAVALVAGTDL